jgi:peptidylprolyl isomerase/peptidyl-prolyl cis-trans isomerase D
MAILSKIRERSMALILVIGLALFAFVLDPSSIQDFFNSTKVNTVGEIGDETISRKEFSEAVEAYKAQAGNRVTDMQASKTVWNNLVREKIYQTQLAQAGITVGESDVWNALIENPSIKSDPTYQNEAGLFDEGKLKEFLATIKDDSSQQATWNAWTNYMAQIKSNLENTTYNNLITAGLGSSLKEGELQYLNDNTKITSQFVYVPYASVSDSLIKIKKSEINTYVKAHASNFKIEASRDIKTVRFNILPTAEDEEAIKNEVTALLSDSDNSKGLKNTTNVKEFFIDNDSDQPLDLKYNFKNTVSVIIADAVFNGAKGDVFGPYKDRGHFKISKITEVVQMPDSVKGAHILIPFIGSVSANATTTKTEEQAKKSADSIFKLVRRNKKKFAAIASEINPDGTKDKGGDIGWITKDIAYSQNFDVDFADFLFFSKTATVKVVKSKFGYQVIRLDESKNKQAAVKLATYAKEIVASQETENTIFQNAETFSLELSNGKKFDDIVKEKGLVSSVGNGLKALDESVPGIGNERSIVSWVFNSETEIGSFKRFDIPSGHIVVILTNTTDKGLMSAAKAAPIVRPILVNEKKAVIINTKMAGSTLEAIASANNQTVKSASTISLLTPMLAGAGFEPKGVAAISSAKENTVYTNVEGNKGVFAFVVTKRELPVNLPNYDSYRKRIADGRKQETGAMYEAIKKAANVEDNRNTFYGVN